MEKEKRCQMRRNPKNISLHCSVSELLMRCDANGRMNDEWISFHSLLFLVNRFLHRNTRCESVRRKTCTPGETHLKLLLQKRQLRYQITDRVCDGILRQVLSRRLHSQHELVLQWMWYFVSGKHDVRIFQQLPVSCAFRMCVLVSCK